MAGSLFDDFVGFDTAVGVRVVLGRVEHGMCVGDERLLRFGVARLVGMPGAIRVDG